MDITPAIHRKFIRPLLFSMPSELSHAVVERLLRLGLVWEVQERLARDVPDLPLTAGGLELPNPIGLAAGYDKDGDLIGSLSRLGFGYLTVGTVMRNGQTGNSRRPRIVRVQKDNALLNSLGFPSAGMLRAADHLARHRRRGSGVGVVVSISGLSLNDIVASHRMLEPLADAIEVNIGSPNTPDLLWFQAPGPLGDLLDAVNAGRHRPLFVKLPPFPDRTTFAVEHDRALSLMAVCVARGVNALTIGNSRPVHSPRMGGQIAGLSGKPLYEETVRMVEDARRTVGDAMSINACGGIFTAADAWGALAAGADTVQVMTGMLYRGPGIARDITRGLDCMIRREGMDSIEQVGAHSAEAGGQ